MDTKNEQCLKEVTNDFRFGDENRKRRSGGIGGGGGSEEREAMEGRKSKGMRELNNERKASPPAARSTPF